MASRARFEHHRAGDVIFLKGSPRRSLMAVLDGRVQISSSAEGGRDTAALEDLV
jgi:hypothetical protein